MQALRCAPEIELLADRKEIAELPQIDGFIHTERVSPK
jgi:hypothetical protein